MKTKPSTISKTLSSFLTFFLLIQLIAGIFLFVPKPQEVKANGTSWYNSNWLYRKKITIDHTKVSATLTNFPVLVNLSSDSNLASRAQSDGDDILFTSSDGTTKLSHEIEKYSSSTGELVAYVKIPSLASTTDTEIYMYYGNPSTINQQDVANVWNDNYISTWHLNGSSGVVSDSLQNKYGLIFGTSSSVVAGKIGNAISFGGDGYIHINTSLDSSIKFGVIADIHHTLYPFTYPNIGDNSARMQAFVSAMNSQGANFIITVGDNAHNLKNPVTTTTKLSSSEFLNNIDSLKTDLTAFNGNVYYTLGNHDVLCATTSDTISHLNDPASGSYMPSNYYYFDYPDQRWRFVVLDSQYNLDGTDKGPSDNDYSEGYIPPAEQTWLTNTLNNASSSGYKVIIFNHQKITVTGTSGINNSTAIRAIIEGSGVVPLVLQGHRHENESMSYNGVSYVNFYSPVDHGSDTSNDDWALVDVKTDGSILITGSGSVKNLSFNTNNLAVVPSGAKKWSVSTWVKGNTWSNDSWGNGIYYESLLSGDELSRFRLKITALGILAVGYRDTAGSFKEFGDSSSTISTNSWHYVVVTVDTDTDIAEYYIDGIHDKTNSFSGGPITTSGKINIIGAGQITTSAYQGYFKGLIDELRISTTTLSASWIATEYNNQNSPSTFYSLGSEDGYPITPTIRTPSVLSANSIRWNFTDNNSYETGFNLYDNTGTLVTTSATANLTYLDENALSENTQYTRYVKAYNSYGESASSSATSTYTLVDTPTNLTATQITTTSVALSLDSFPNATSSSSGYYFANTTKGTNSGWIQTNTWSETTLLPNTQYTYTVKYRNGNGVETGTATTTQYTIIQSPTSVSFDSIGVSSITVSASGTLSNLASSTSGVYFDETSGNSGGADSTWLQTNSYQNTGLSENTQYTYQVKARNGDGTVTSYTATSSKYTLADTPTGLTTINTADQSITVSVDTLPNATSGSSGYYFSQDSHNSGWIKTNSWQDTGLACGTNYTYSVIYRNGNGAETSAISQTFRTPNCSGAIIISPQIDQQLIQPQSSIPTVTFEKPISQMTRDELLAKIAEITQAISQIKSLMSNNQLSNPPSNIPTAFFFTTNLKQGVINIAVKYLQMLLNQGKDTQLAESGVGSLGNETTYFGPKTTQAVIKFQEKYKDEILKPLGFISGTGFVGKTTRDKLNELLGK
jgi:hypothetical protein